MKPTPIERILLVIAILLVLLLLMSSLAQAQTPAQGVQITDDRGRVVALPQPPQRIVTLLPSLAETVCALGACQRLVGVDRYTNWPPALAGVPRVGGGLGPNIEAIVSVRFTPAPAPDGRRTIGSRLLIPLRSTCSVQDCPSQYR